MNPQWGRLVRSCDKCNKLYLHFQKTNGHQLGKMLTYHEGLSSFKPHDCLIIWSMWGHVILWKIYFPTLQELWPLNLAGCWVTGEGSALTSCWLLIDFLFNLFLSCSVRVNIHLNVDIDIIYPCRLKSNAMSHGLWTLFSIISFGLA